MSTDPDAAVTGSFDLAGQDDWEASAAKALRGRPLESLDTTTLDGIVRSPLYTRERHSMDADESGLPGAAPFARGGSAAGTVLGWEIRQRHDARAEGSNDAVLRDLERGVTGIELQGAPETVDELDPVLDGVYLDLAPVHLAPGSSAAQRAALLALGERRGVAGSAQSGCLGADPIGDLARHGALATSLAQAMGDVATEAVERAGAHPCVATIAVDGSPYADAGATDAQELACIWAAAVAWLRALTEAGGDVAAANHHIEFTATVGPDQFVDIAKLRATRIGWARILEASGAGLEAAPMRLHATTAAAMMTQRDPWVNMLRTTTSCFAAAVGGADAITVRPFDSAIGSSDELGLRVARNTQLILQEETNASGVIDPSGGSWYVEDLTRQLAAEAWTRFQAIEGAGGIGAALLSGSVQATIAQTRATRLEQLSTRRLPITGVSEFPDVHEAPLRRAEKLAAPPAAGGGDSCEPLEPLRWAAPFERLRDDADAAAMRIFLANLGPVATHTARATFAKNLFEVGGVEALGNEGFDDVAAAAAAFADSGARVACICSSDTVYAEQAPQAAAALRAAGAEIVFLAGAPGDHEDAWRAAGVDDFISLGCDVLAVLRRVHEVHSN